MRSQTATKVHVMTERITPKKLVCIIMMMEALGKGGKTVQINSARRIQIQKYTKTKMKMMSLYNQLQLR
jgi:hypothetical protein